MNKLFYFALAVSSGVAQYPSPNYLPGLKNDQSITNGPISTKGGQYSNGGYPGGPNGYNRNNLISGGYSSSNSGGYSSSNSGSYSSSDSGSYSSSDSVGFNGVNNPGSYPTASSNSYSSSSAGSYTGGASPIVSNGQRNGYNGNALRGGVNNGNGYNGNALRGGVNNGNGYNGNALRVGVNNGNGYNGNALRGGVNNGNGYNGNALRGGVNNGRVSYNDGRTGYNDGRTGSNDGQVVGYNGGRTGSNDGRVVSYNDGRTGYNDGRTGYNDRRAGYNNVGTGYNGQDESSEPAKYEFKYDVLAPEYGNEFGHAEKRDGDVTTGSYYVLLPDGRRQLVEYTADKDGFKPRISYTEPAVGATAYNGQAVGQRAQYTKQPTSAYNSQTSQGYISGRPGNLGNGRINYQSTQPSLAGDNNYSGSQSSGY